MSYPDFVAANRRWTILKLLAGATPPEFDAGLIHKGIAYLNPTHKVGLSTILADLRWLENHLLVELSVESDLVSAKLTQRGADVAAGSEHVDGVDEPPLG
jgi:hypothetical protein